MGQGASSPDLHGYTKASLMTIGVWRGYCLSLRGYTGTTPMEAGVQWHFCTLLPACAGCSREASASEGLRAHRAHLTASSCPCWLAEGIKPLDGSRHTGVGLVVLACSCWLPAGGQPSSVGGSTEMFLAAGAGFKLVIFLQIISVDYLLLFALYLAIYYRKRANLLCASQATCFCGISGTNIS